MAALGAIVLFHLDTGIDRPAIVMKTDGTNHDLFVFVDPAVDAVALAQDPTQPPVYVKVIRNVLSGAGIGSFT